MHFDNFFYIILNNYELILKFLIIIFKENILKIIYRKCLFKIDIIK